MYKLIAAVAGIILLGGCDGFSSKQTSEGEIQVTPKLVKLSDTLPEDDQTLLEIPAVFKPDGSETIAIAGTSGIPYPVFPEATQYRIGGEDGLHIVLFETTASFDEVDSFYQRHQENGGMSRLQAMNDYVRYTAGENDSDAWDNNKPGIVIHGFQNQNEAVQTGADPDSKTNIIISF